MTGIAVAKISISIDDGLLERIRARADAGVSGWIAQAAEERLRTSGPTDEQWDAALEAIEAAKLSSGLADVSVNHDDYVEDDW